MKRAASALLGSRPISRSFLVATRRHLRVLAYHDVAAGHRLRQHFAYLRNHFNPVAERDVHDWASGLRELPRRAVWVTFDDGDPTVVEAAQPALDAFDIKATMFVCPGVVDTGNALWFQIVDAAAQAEVIPDSLAEKQRLKSMDDRTRREAIATLERTLAERGTGVTRRQLNSAAIRSWLAAGHSVGDHTWDHPTLETMSTDELREQIARSSAWFADHGIEALSFAYPNGDFVADAPEILRSAGYRLAVLFDHRLQRHLVDPFSISRLSVDSSAPVERFAAITSGAHSHVMHATARLRRRPR